MTLLGYALYEFRKPISLRTPPISVHYMPISVCKTYAKIDPLQIVVLMPLFETSVQEPMN